MKLVCVFLLQILLLFAAHAVTAYTNFMDNIVSFFKAASRNHTAFDLRKLIDKSDENDRLDAIKDKEGMKHNFIDTGKYEDKNNRTIKDNSKDNVNNTNPILLQLPNHPDFNSTKNSSIISQTLEDENNHKIENKTKFNNRISLELPKDPEYNSTKNSSIVSQILQDVNNFTKEDQSKDNNNINRISLQLPKDSDYNSTKYSSFTSKTLKNISKEMDETEEVYDVEEELKAATPFSIIDKARWTIMRGESLRRQHKEDFEKTSSSSSSQEMPDWKTEFERLWAHKKFEALNESRPKGDTVNMAAARPWGVQCGDPSQHDMPWGNCMLAMECEPEFRIYRGDNFCGKTQFVCCAVQISSYNMYQGFDVSLDHDSYDTGSEEKKDNGKTSKEKRKKKKERDKRKRKRIRERNTIKIRKQIKKIIKEIKKILNRQYKNRTQTIRKKTTQLKKFVKKLKKQLKRDRKTVQNMHEKEMINIDDHVLNTLTNIKKINKNFVHNATFRDIVVNGTITKEGARLLLQAYPELDEYMERRRMSRRRMTSNLSDEDLVYQLQYDYN